GWTFHSNRFSLPVYLCVLFVTYVLPPALNALPEGAGVGGGGVTVGSGKNIALRKEENKSS
ncbi:MAG: hypothetical protein ABJI00_08530, partial [Paracoccaceae bacterium]